MSKKPIQLKAVEGSSKSVKVSKPKKKWTLELKLTSNEGDLMSRGTNIDECPCGECDGFAVEQVLGETFMWLEELGIELFPRDDDEQFQNNKPVDKKTPLS